MKVLCTEVISNTTYNIVTLYRIYEVYSCVDKGDPESPRLWYTFRDDHGNPATLEAHEDYDGLVLSCSNNEVVFAVFAIVEEWSGGIISYDDDY